MKSLLKQNNPDDSLESTYFQKGYQRVIGIDEAGRGCWAGPVAVACYILQPETSLIEGVNDSKKLSAVKRENKFAQFSKGSFKVYFASSSEIDRLGIVGAITMLIGKIQKEFDDGSSYFLIDGYFKQKFPNSSQIIKGDSLHYCIAAASISAKVVRDRRLEGLSEKYPDYGFAENKGYGTAKHIQVLTKKGICPEHRLSYLPVKNISEGRSYDAGKSQTKFGKARRATGRTNITK